MPRVLDDGGHNTWRLLRLKNVVGTRSNAPAEVELDGTWAARLGEEGKGLRTLAGMLSATRLDAVLRSAGQMRQAVSRAVHHARHRESFGSALIDKPLMQNVLADLALESEAATVLAMRLAAAVDAGETELLRAAVPVAKFWVCKRTTGVVAEALECLGGNGYVEERPGPGVPRLAGRPAVGGPGNISALDVLRAGPRAATVEVPRRGGDGPGGPTGASTRRSTGAARSSPRSTRQAPAAWSSRWRWCCRGRCWCGTPRRTVADAFCAARLDGDYGLALGTLPAGLDTAAIVARATPDLLLSRHQPGMSDGGNGGGGSLETGGTLFK